MGSTVWNTRYVIFLFRNRNEGISIQKVFNILAPKLAKSNIIQSYYMPHAGAKAKTILQNLWYVLKHKRSDSIYHITGAIHYVSYVLPKNRTITTVHDLLMLDRAASYSYLKRKIFHFLWCKSLSRNKFIICISEKTKQDLLRYIRIPNNKIRVIGDPIQDFYKYSPKIFNDNTPVILHIGTKDNKNLENSIIALHGLNIHLRIIGKLTANQLNLLNNSGISYSNDFNISEEQMYHEYLKCDIVNFPSLYEGFGMPIIEAQAIGRVCITSNISPMNKVAGEGALLINPSNTDDMRAGYINLINNTKLRESLIERGLINVERYKAVTIANEYNKLYEQIF